MATKRVITSFVLLLVLLSFSSCDPVATLNPEELAVVRQAVEDDLLSHISASYFVSRRWGRYDDHPRSPFFEEMLVDRSEGLTLTHHLSTASVDRRSYYNDGVMRIENRTRSALATIYPDVADLEFLYRLESDLINMAKLFDDRFVDRVHAYSFTHTSAAPTPIRIHYNFDIDAVNASGLFQRQYESLNFLVIVDVHSNRLSALIATFVYNGDMIHFNYITPYNESFY